LFFSEEKRAVVIEALKDCPNIEVGWWSTGPVTA